MNPEEEMVAGYIDGLDLDSPEPSSNRSHSYRHGFENGRDDKLHRKLFLAPTLRIMAEAAIRMDTQ